MLATAAQFKKLLLDIHLYRSLAPWGCFRRNVTRKKNLKTTQDRKNLSGNLRNCGRKKPLCPRPGTRGAPGYPGYISGKMSASSSQYTEGDSQGAQGFSNKTPIKSGLKRDCRSRCFTAKLRGPPAVPPTFRSEPAPAI